MRRLARLPVAAFAIAGLLAACTPEGEPMPIGGRTVEVPSGPIDVTEGDPRHAPLLAVMHAAFAEDLEQPVLLDVQRLRERSGWAFAEVYPRTPAGQQIDYLRTRYEDERRSGILEDDAAFILLRYDNGVWRVRELSLNIPGNAWDTWAREHGAPPEIFHLAGG
jgi:hypothetical protein